MDKETIKLLFGATFGGFAWGFCFWAGYQLGALLSYLSTFFGA